MATLSAPSDKSDVGRPISRVDSELKNDIVAQFYREWKGAKMYHRIGNHLYSLGYRGAAKFFWEQCKEEEEHANMVNMILLKVGIDLYTVQVLPQSVEEEVRLQKAAIDTIGSNFDAVKNVVKFALSYEQHLSSRIEALYYKASMQKNFYVSDFLKKLAQEQIEEEETFSDLVTKVERYDGSRTDMYDFDEHLGNLASQRKC